LNQQFYTQVKGIDKRAELVQFVNDASGSTGVDRNQRRTEEFEQDALRFCLLVLSAMIRPFDTDNCILKGLSK
jgi:hypothetical protein